MELWRSSSYTNSLMYLPRMRFDLEKVWEEWCRAVFPKLETYADLGLIGVPLSQLHLNQLTRKRSNYFVAKL
jgi:hypothetical protein